MERRYFQSQLGEAMQLVSPQVMRVVYPVSLEIDQFQALKRQQVRFQFDVEEKTLSPAQNGCSQ